MTIEETACWLQERDRFLILTHVRPDGDTVGCAAALCAALRQIGKTAYVLPNPELTATCADYVTCYHAPKDYVPACIVSTDVASLGLLPENAAPYWAHIDLAIDHHPSYEGFATASCIQSDKAAAGEIVYALVCALGVMTPKIATALYCAVSTDTGCFQYSNTTADTHRVAAALMDTGIDVFPLNKRHFRTKSWARLQVERLLTERMHRYEGGKIAVAPVSLSLMDEAGATEEDMEDIAAFLGQIEGVETSVTIRELAEGGCKLSVRTSGGLNATKVCARLGGGGHAAAAGCTVSGTLAEAEAAILDAIRQVEAGA